MKKRSFLVGGLLAGLLGYWYSQRETTPTRPTLPATLSGVEERAPRAEVPSRLYQRAVPSSRLPVLPSLENEYQQYLHSVDFRLDRFYREPARSECDETKLAEKYQAALVCYYQTITANQPSLDNPAENPTSIDTLLAADELAKVKIKQANCFHSGTGQWEKIIRSVASSYAEIKAFPEAARACYAVGDLECTLDKLVAGGTKCADKAIALAREEELPDLLDWYFNQGDLLSAGKVEWVNGDKERAQELILQSPEFRRAELVAIKLIAQGLYTEAFRQFWDLKIPFFRDIAQKLCLQDEACRQELQEYNTSDEDSVSVDGC